MKEFRIIETNIGFLVQTKDVVFLDEDRDSMWHDVTTPFLFLWMARIQKWHLERQARVILDFIKSRGEEKVVG